MTLLGHKLLNIRTTVHLALQTFTQSRHRRRHGPFYVDRSIKLEQDVVSSHWSDGPEEVLAHVGLLQRVALIHFKRGGNFSRRVHVDLMQQRFQEVFILREQKAKEVKTANRKCK